VIDEEGIEYCSECRHPVIWHSHRGRVGRCCECTEHQGKCEHINTTSVRLSGVGELTGCQDCDAQW
jgi:hypothetical protein